jgi:hypothetical protein
MKSLLLLLLLLCLITQSSYSVVDTNEALPVILGAKASYPIGEPDPKVEEELISFVYENAEKYDLYVPSFHRWKYIPKFSVGKLKPSGAVEMSTMRLIDNTDEMDEDELIFGAITYMGSRRSIYYKGTAANSYVESSSMEGNNIIFTIRKRSAIATALFTVAHELSHVNGEYSETVSDMEGQAAVDKHLELQDKELQ